LVHTVGAGVTGQVELLDRRQDVHHKQAAAWLQDNGNPHEKGFDVTGERNVNPHAFRVDKELFTNSIARGMMSKMIKLTDYKKYCPFFSSDWPVQHGRLAGPWQ
jgi:hypothetical protein